MSALTLSTLMLLCRNLSLPRIPQSWGHPWPPEVAQGRRRRR